MKEDAAVSERQTTIENLIADRAQFNAFVYMNMFDAVKELERRQNTPDSIVKKPPDPMSGKKSAVLFRHIATPNYEVRRFMSIGDVLLDYGIQPLILEYLSDKFTNRNEWKYYLGRISAYKGKNKKDESIFETKMVIDFLKSDMKPLSEVKTHWDESLVDMHHRLFLRYFPMMKGGIFDMSLWLKEHGNNAKEYYKSFLKLFIKDGILFENFLINGKELAFTKNIILPALIDIEKETGMRPLIVALEPTDIEGDQFWLSHPHQEGFFDGLSK